MSIEQDLDRVLEFLSEERKATDDARQNDANRAWGLFTDAAVSFVGQHGPALLSALADQRRLREAATGEVECCDAKGAWLIMSHDAPVTKGQRVAIVPLDQEGE